MQHEKTKRDKEKKTPTAEYPRARFSIQPLHLPLMRLAFVRELFGSSAILVRIRRVALFERARHRVALFVRARAQGHVVVVLSIDEVLVLRRAFGSVTHSRAVVLMRGERKRARGGAHDSSVRRRTRGCWVHGLWLWWV
jgi:hypothetical protein